MKRQGYIYERICDIDNIQEAIRRASKGKKHRKDVQKVLKNADIYAWKIQDMLVLQKYKPNPYKKAIIKDTGTSKKTRIIYKPKFYPDQIIQWAIILQINKILIRGEYKYSCGNVVGRGIHYGKRYLKSKIQHKFKETKYYLQLDVHKFYPSIKIPILIKMLERKIKDKRVINLISNILSLEDELPIGILLSQWLANFYLQGLDHFVKEQLHVKYYLRYVDDMVLFDSNKKRLHKDRIAIANYLKNIGLTLKSNWQVNRTDNGVDILGFRFFRNKVILRKSLMFRITRKIKRVKKRNSYNAHNCMSIISYLGWLKHCNSYTLYINWIKPYINMPKIKSIVRRQLYANNKISKYSKAY